MSDDTSSHVRVFHLYDELLLHFRMKRFTLLPKFAALLAFLAWGRLEVRIKHDILRLFVQRLLAVEFMKLFFSVFLFSILRFQACAKAAGKSF